ncbi:DDE-type integrase/transposase/recombinase [Palleronia aestuarii]|uniref:DDE-type integrase/transposase/recombinase n=1 Tax=Palleronia aestuarii TaxID=568105 RepID=UPI000DABFA1C
MWWAIDAAGDILDILARSRRHAVTARRFMRKLFRRWDLPRVMKLDKLRSYAAATAKLAPWLRASPPQGDQRRGLSIASAYEETKKGHGAVHVNATGAAVPVGSRPDRLHCRRLSARSYRHAGREAFDLWADYSTDLSA